MPCESVVAMEEIEETGKRRRLESPSRLPTLEVSKKKSTKKEKPFEYRLNVTNGDFLRKFLSIYSKCVEKLHFRLTYTDEFKGFRLDAHNSSWTLANKSRFECRLEIGEKNGKPQDPALLNGISFTVNAVNFMNKLSCSVIPETVLTLTNYGDETIVLSSTSNEDDVISKYSCQLLENVSTEGLDGLKLTAGFHVNVLTKTLKKLSNNADVCGSADLRFTLRQALDPHNPSIIHSEIFIGFKDPRSSATEYDGTTFYVSATKSINDSVTTWELCDAPDERESIPFQLKSSNDYDNSNLRVLLSHVSCEWCMVHLDNESGSGAPLVIVCELSGKNTKHTLILSAKDEREE